MEWLWTLDGNILLWIQENMRADWITPFWKAITFLGNSGWFWIVASLILLVPKKTRMIGLTALIAIAIGALITNVGLKNIVARTRPYEVVDGLTRLIEAQHDYSFPSGHTCASFAVAGVYFHMFSKRFWAWGSLVLAALIMFSRLYVGVHYPTDVLVGLLVGIFAAWLACKIYEKWLKQRMKSENRIETGV